MGNLESLEPEISIGATDVPTAVDDPVRKLAHGSQLVGERFGKYLIVGELAVGGMAEVFLGVQHGLEGFTKVVVIKRVLPAYSSEPDFVQMFIDEARLAARLEHPNIVRTYEFGEVGGQYFTVMEYLPGEDVNKLLSRFAVSKQHTPIHLAAGIMSRVCQGLHFAHELTDTAGRPLGLVHRDINPANIVVTYGGEVKIIDFGVAKTVETHTKSGTIKGKISYMSPEQLLGRGIDRRSDLFSAGVVLWELLTGMPLFTRDNEASTIYAIMNAAIPAPSRHRADVPRELDAIVLRALSRTPVDRFDTAEDMANALDAFLTRQHRCDARSLAGMLETMFGTTRAEAKRAIAQSSSLDHNISLVMKRRSTQIRTDLAGGSLNPVLALGSDLAAQPEIIEPEPEPARGSGLAYVIALVLLVAAFGGGAYYFTRSSEPAPAPVIAPTPTAAIRIESTPPGAAITLGGEPTGLTTPATLTGVTSHRIAVGLALPGYQHRDETIDVPATGTVTKRFELVAEPQQ